VRGRWPGIDVRDSLLQLPHASPEVACHARQPRAAEEEHEHDSERDELPLADPEGHATIVAGAAGTRLQHAISVRIPPIALSNCEGSRSAARVLEMRLYNSQVSGNCYKVRLLFAHLGVRYETVEVDVVERSNRPELLGGLNPALRVPTLVLDDGRPLAESNAILWYFGDGTAYVPHDAYERAQTLQWMFFEQYSHEPYIAVARFLLVYSGRADEHRELIASKLPGGYRALEAMERHLDGGDFLVGGGYTVADMSLYAYTHVAHEGGFELDRFPAIRAWLERVAAQPGHVPITG
jgi:glutathione S-transferase